MSPSILASELTISPEPLGRAVRRSGRADSSFFSTKMRRWLPSESAGERAFLRLAELDPRIAEIYSRPTEVFYRSRHGAGVTYPDFAIKIEGAWEFHDVKNAADYASPLTNEKLFWVGRELEQKGVPYSVSLTEDLNPVALSEPIGDLLRRLKTVIPATIQFAALRSCEREAITARQFLAGAPDGTQFLHIEALVAQGHFWTDLRAPLHLESVLYRPSTVYFDRLIPFSAPTRPPNLPIWVA